MKEKCLSLQHERKRFSPAEMKDLLRASPTPLLEAAKASKDGMRLLNSRENLRMKRNLVIAKDGLKL